MMNTSAIICLLMAVTFLLLTLVFALLKEKGAMLISGFNTLPKGQREQYDSLRMSKDMRNTLLLWTLLFTAGGLLSYHLPVYKTLILILVIITWLILLFREIHFDAEKAFGKYRL